LHTHVFVALLCGFVGTRLVHVVLYEPAYYLEAPLRVFKIWEGGMASFGGIIGGALGVFGYAWYKRYDRTYLIKLLDLFAIGSLVGWIFGRVGCFCIHDHLGVPCSCALAIETPEGPRLDLALIELIGLAPLAVLFWIMHKRTVRDGTFISVYLVYYGVLRFCIDFYRVGDARYAGLTPAQYFATLMAIVGISFVISRHKKQ
jgi:phosphatidylglycerol:prolipoprotein diacylglycerol transferase